MILEWSRGDIVFKIKDDDYWILGKRTPRVGVTCQFFIYERSVDRKWKKNRWTLNTPRPNERDEA